MTQRHAIRSICSLALFSAAGSTTGVTQFADVQCQEKDSPLRNGDVEIGLTVLLTTPGSAGPRWRKKAA
jgi:hypothetical protein